MTSLQTISVRVLERSPLFQAGTAPDLDLDQGQGQELAVALGSGPAEDTADTELGVLGRD